MILPGLHDYGSRSYVCPRAKKTRYDKKGAQTALKKRLAGKNAPALLRAYECKHCRGWHLTHQPKREA